MMDYTTMTNEAAARRLADRRNAAAIGLPGLMVPASAVLWDVVEGPDEGEWTVMPMEDAMEFAECSAS